MSKAMQFFFAYGTLMLRSQFELIVDPRSTSGQLAQRSQIAKLPGTRPVTTNFGYGAVAPSPNHDTWGVVYRVTDSDLALLDAYETRAYTRQILTVVLPSGKKLQAWVYMPTEPSAIKFPLPLHEGVLSRTLIAAYQRDLPIKYIEKVLIPSLAI